MRVSAPSIGVLALTSVAVVTASALLLLLFRWAQPAPQAVHPAAPERTLSAEDLKKIPIPFAPPADGANLGASLVHVGFRNVNGGQVEVLGAQISATDPQETLLNDKIYLVLTPSSVGTPVPMDYVVRALTGTATGASIDYFGYKYSDANASQEIQHVKDPVFINRFPAQFFASTKAWLVEATQLTAFKAGNGVTFLGSGMQVPTTVYWNPSSLYVLVVNESGGAKLRWYQPACGNRIADSATETCDDGNNANADGCSATCQVESGWACVAGPQGSVCTVMPASSAPSSVASSASGIPSSYAGLSCVAASASGITILDNGQPGYTELFNGEGWQDATGGYGGSRRIGDGATGPLSDAVWCLKNVPDDRYDIYATWQDGSGGASQVTYTAYRRDGVAANAIGWQLAAPIGITYKGTLWQLLATNVSLADYSKVALSKGTPFVQADAVMVVRHGLSLAPPVCGNGTKEAGEECDDGNTSNTDACINTCHNAVCGDTFVQPSLGEECDLGAQNGQAGATCTSACQISTPIPF